MIDYPGIKTTAYKPVKAALLSIFNALNTGLFFTTSGNDIS